MAPNETKNLSWKDAWWYLLNGEKIKRTLWDGYWVWENNTNMYFQIPEGEKAFAYAIKTRDGKYARLKLEVSDTCPEWAKDVLEGEKYDQ